MQDPPLSAWGTVTGTCRWGLVAALLYLKGTGDRKWSAWIKHEGRQLCSSAQRIQSEPTRNYTTNRDFPKLRIISLIEDTKTQVGDNITNWRLEISESGKAESETKIPNQQLN